MNDLQSKILGNECILDSSDSNSNAATTFNNNNNIKSTESHQINRDVSLELHLSDNEIDQCDDQIDENSIDDEQSSEPSNDASALRSKNYSSSQRVQFASPKSSSETPLDDRRLRRQIANCNERRRMQSINAGFQALRQFLPQRCGEKLSKAAILQQTAELIQTLQLGRRSANDQCKPTSDEEANAEIDRPQCKKRRITIKTEQKQANEMKRECEVGHPERQVGEYIKIIEELREALNKEQQLRLLYEQKLTELKSTLSASLGFGSLPNGMNLERNENIQQPTLHQRSSSADGLLPPKIQSEHNNSTTSLFYNNLVAATEAALNYNNQMRLARQSSNNALSALLSPTQQLALQLGNTTPFAQQPIQNVVPLVNLLAASLHNNHDSPLPLTSPSQPPVTTQQPTQNTLFAIAEALRQIESENSKNFPSENLPTDVLVR